MPEEGMVWLDRSEILTFDEIYRIANILVERFGLESIRLTGGEPTLRRELHVLVSRLASLGVELSMTTNGATLERHAVDLFEAGLTRINISLDTLDRQKFVELTRRDQLQQVIEGIDAAKQAGFDPVKVNVMLMKGINDTEIIDFLEFGRTSDVVIRFIEFMPLDAGEEWSQDRVVAASEIMDQVTEHYRSESLERGSSPAERFRFEPKSDVSSDLGENAQWGEFGIIASVSEPFCESCDRIRLTSDGQLRNCLFALEHLDLRALLRGGGTDEQLAKAIVEEVEAKRSGHNIGQVYFIRPSKSMSQVGG